MYLWISGIQHFMYCRRQWALIYVEQQWQESVDTVLGDLFHQRVHTARTEKRGDTIIARGLHVRSHALKANGICDVVEFRRSDGGVSLHGRAGKYDVIPIEYKKGRPKKHRADEVQLCAQAICLEEMLLAGIPRGYLFYGEKRRRTEVVFTEELKEQVKQMFEEMHNYVERGYTPMVKKTDRCKRCSLQHICLPQMAGAQSATDYMKNTLFEEEK